MTLRQIGAVAILCALMFALSIPAAEARPRHKIQRYAAPAVSQCVSDNSGRQVCSGAVEHTTRHARITAAPARQWGGGGDTGLIAKARGYLGTNPTGWAKLWCGRFMAMIAPAAAARVRNPNMARDWATLPRVAPQIGAIAVISRGRGGHVGVVTAIDANGNPTVISGNHNRKVGEGVYPASRIIAYVSPS